MPQPAQLTKAKLKEIQWDENNQVSETGEHIVEVQFNPQTLKVTFSNQLAGGDQGGGSGKQYVGKGATKLSLELWFDVTVPWNGKGEDPKGDVRNLTKEVIYFITPKPEGDKFIPPGLRFVWGTFLFDGIVDSMDESLEFFSEDGKPLRSKVTLGAAQQEIQFQFNEPSTEAPAGADGSSAQPGTQPMEQAKEGDTVQDMAGSAGRADDWKNIALANNIENPRQLLPGVLVNVHGI